MKLWTTALCLIALSPVAHAEKIALSKSELFFEGGTKKTFDVLNLLPEKAAYFKTEVFEVVSPELGIKSELREINPSIDRGLIVTPSRSVIKPNESHKTISVLNTVNSSDEEKVYRIQVSPVISGIKNSPDTKVKLLLAYDILVHVKPKVAQFTYSYGLEDGAPYIENTGNTHFTISHGQACNPNGDICEELPRWYIYPGVKASIPVKNKSNTDVTYRVFMRGEEPKEIKYQTGE